MLHSLRLVMIGAVLSASACTAMGDEGLTTPADPGPTDLLADQTGLPPPAPTELDLDAAALRDPGPASLAAAPCTRRADGRWNCVNRVPSRIFESGTGRHIDNLRTNPSWFVCRAEAGFSGGGTHPTRWEWTQGDDVGAWGWVRDIDIASETDPMSLCFPGGAAKPIPRPTPPAFHPSSDTDR